MRFYKLAQIHEFIQLEQPWWCFFTASNISVDSQILDSPPSQLKCSINTHVYPVKLSNMFHCKEIVCNALVSSSYLHIWLPLSALPYLWEVWSWISLLFPPFGLPLSLWLDLFPLPNEETNPSAIKHILVMTIEQEKHTDAYAGAICLSTKCCATKQAS